jgi:hypothetical protein
MIMRQTARPRNLGEHQAQILRNAAFAQLEGSKAADLRRWLRHDDFPGRKVVFVYDSDVVLSYCAPWKTGPAEEDREGNGVGQVLPLRPLAFSPSSSAIEIIRQERQQSEAIARLLSRRAILLNSEQKHPIYQLSSHYDETLEIFRIVREEVEAVTRHDEAHILNRQTDEIRTALVLLKAEVENPGSIEFMQRNVGGFSVFLARKLLERSKSRHASVREWDNYYELNTAYGGIFDVENFVEVHASNDSTVSKILQAFITQRNSSEYDSLRLFFGKTLSRFRIRQHKPETDVTDADSLAQLALLNSISRQQGGEVRFILITGDRNLVNGLGVDTSALPKRAPMNKVQEFCDTYVHHLWSLIDSMIEEVSGEKNEKIPMRPPELFSGLLAFEEDAPKNERRERLKLLANSGDTRYSHYLNDKDIDAAYDRWEDFAGNASSADRFLEKFESEGKLQARLRDSILQVVREERGEGFSWSKLQDLVSETLSRERDRSNVTFSDMGADALMAAQINGERNPPDLMFDSFKNTDKIFRRLASAERVYRSVEQFKQDFDAIAKDCYDPEMPHDDDRLESYLKYLVLGSVVASSDRWAVAEEHAASAVAIVERSKRLRVPISVRGDLNKVSNVSGREAYFLRSVARRIRARDSRDLQRSMRFLEEAEAALTIDKDFNKNLRISDVRFKNERLAHALSTYYIARSMKSDDFCDIEANCIWPALHDIFPKPSGVDLRQLTSKDFSDLLARDDLRWGTIASLATNICQVCVVREFRKRNSREEKHEYRISKEFLSSAISFISQFTDFQSRFKDRLGFTYPENRPIGEYTICSELMFRYSIIAAQILRQDDHWYPMTAKQVDQIFGSESGVAYYDRWRFEKLHELSRMVLSPSTKD